MKGERTVLMMWEEAKRDWAEKGYEFSDAIAIKGSEATEADKADTGKVIIYWA
jgi:hypothetical protein